MLFPAFGAWADKRRCGRVHPAWWWGIGTLIGSFLLTEAITYGPLGPPLYEAVSHGYPGAAFPPLDFSRPEGRLMTGRS